MPEFEPPRRQSFSAELRLTRQADFDRVFESGRHAADQVLVLHACRNQLGHSRLGLSVSRRVGGAVVRNRWKRRIREAWRRQRDQLPDGLDVVVRPRKGATLNYQAIERSLRGLTQRLARQLARA